MSNKHIDPLFPVWCHKILPLVYDESLSYYEKLCKILQKLNEAINSQNNLQNEFYQLKDWINSQLELYSKEQLEEWLDDGTLENIVLQLDTVGKEKRGWWRSCIYEKPFGLSPKKRFRA